MSSACVSYVAAAAMPYALKSASAPSIALSTKAVVASSRSRSCPSARTTSSWSSLVRAKVEMKWALSCRVATAYRGLDPRSPLFLTAGGEAFAITHDRSGGRQRWLCRQMLEICRSLFRHAQIEGVSAVTVRRTVAARLVERGADEEQVGLILGITERRAVRALLPRKEVDLAALARNLV
jgi:hypothetical protein